MSPLFFIDDGADRVAEARLAEADVYRMQHDAEARFLRVRRGRVLAEGRDPARIAWQPPHAVPAAEREASVFLGLLEGRPCFALVPTETPQTPEDRYRSGYGVDAEGFVGLYQAAVDLPPAEARLAARAAHLANWINRTRHCGVCGAPMHGAGAGHKRVCSGCAREEFARVDPVVIALVTRGDYCLLGRQPKFAPGRYSTVAGFVEPGETLEAAVRREVAEEAGVGVERIEYVASQPWPFPASLMLGFIARATSETITLNDRELEEARWFERAQVAAAAARDGAGGEGVLTLPPPGSIARRLIEHWLARTGGAG